MENGEKLRKIYKKKFIAGSGRDTLIYIFLDKVGVASYEQIGKWLEIKDSRPSTYSAIKQRLCTLANFGYLKRFNTKYGSYYGLTSKTQREYGLIQNLRLGDLDHENFLRNIWLDAGAQDHWLTSRQIKSQIKIQHKTTDLVTPIPDLIMYDDEFEREILHIEYEHSRKSLNDMQIVLTNIIHSPRRTKNESQVWFIFKDDGVLNSYKKSIIELGASIIDEQKYISLDVYFLKLMTSCGECSLANSAIVYLTSYAEYLEKFKVIKHLAMNG